MFGLAVAALAPGYAAAEPVTVDVFTTVRFSDNMAQRPDDEAEADIEYRPGIRIAHVKDPGQCNSALSSEFAYLFYQDDTLEDQTSAFLDWNGDCEILPYLNWRASDRLTESARNNRGTNTVANRERKNVFSTGPQLVLPLGQLNTFIASVDWRKTNFEEADRNNSERWVGNARLQREFSPLMQGWLSTTYSDSEFDDGEEIQETSYRVGASRQINRTLISGDIGVTTLERESDVGAGESEGVVWDVRATHALDVGSLYASVSRRLTDVSSDVEIAFGDIRFSFTDTQAVEVTNFTTGARFRLDGGYSANTSVYYQEYDYIDSAELEEITGIQGGVSKALTELLALTGSVRYERLDFQPSGAEGNEYAARVGMSYRRTRDLTFALDIGHETQDGQGAVAEYSENYVAATVRYNLR